DGANETVAREGAVCLPRPAPAERLSWIAKQFAAASSDVDEVLSIYGRFLERTAANEDELIAQITRGERLSGLDQPQFGDAVFRLLRKIGSNGNLLYRMIVV